MGDTIKETKTQVLDLSKYSFAPPMEGMEKFWITTGDRGRVDVMSHSAEESGNIYFKTTDEANLYIHLGRSFKTLQQVAPELSLTFIVNVMKPNPNTSEANIRSVEKEYNRDMTTFREAQKKNYFQLHFAREVAE